MSKQKMMDFIYNHIANQSNSMKRDFSLWKNENKFLYAGICSSPEDDFFTVCYSFSNKKIYFVSAKNDFMMWHETFKDELFVKEVSKEQAENIGFDFYVVECDNIPGWEYKKGTYQELLDAPVLSTAGNLKDLSCAVKDHYGFDEYDISKMYDLNLENIVVEVIYQKVDSNFKWGDITGRILFNNEVIGHFNRNGRYMEDYMYYTHDLNKWKEMLESIVEKLNIMNNDFENLKVFSKDDDIYKFANLEGRDK